MFFSDVSVAVAVAFVVVVVVVVAAAVLFLKLFVKLVYSQSEFKYLIVVGVYEEGLYNPIVYLP
jgi:hypothetical protein